MTPKEIIDEMEMFSVRHMPDSLSPGAQWALDQLINHMKKWFAARENGSTQDPGLEKDHLNPTKQTTDI